MFAQASAARVAASSTAAPPVSARRKSRAGVPRLRAHAVVPRARPEPSVSAESATSLTLLVTRLAADQPIEHELVALLGRDAVLATRRSRPHSIPRACSTRARRSPEPALLWARSGTRCLVFSEGQGGGWCA